VGTRILGLVMFLYSMPISWADTPPPATNPSSPTLEETIKWITTKLDSYWQPEHGPCAGTAWVVVKEPVAFAEGTLFLKLTYKCEEYCGYDGSVITHTETDKIPLGALHPTESRLIDSRAGSVLIQSKGGPKITQSIHPEYYCYGRLIDGVWRYSWLKNDSGFSDTTELVQSVQIPIAGQELGDRLFKAFVHAMTLCGAKADEAF
jgi:hypothetical protein